MTRSQVMILVWIVSAMAAWLIFLAIGFSLFELFEHSKERLGIAGAFLQSAGLGAILVITVALIILRSPR